MRQVGLIYRVVAMATLTVLNIWEALMGGNIPRNPHTDSMNILFYIHKTLVLLTLVVVVNGGRKIKGRNMLQRHILTNGTRQTCAPFGDATPPSSARAISGRAQHCALNLEKWW